MKCAMSVAALPGGMLGDRSRLRPLPLSLVGWCASCNNNNNNHHLYLKKVEYLSIYQQSHITDQFSNVDLTLGLLVAG